MTALPSDDEVPRAELAPLRMVDGGTSERERRLIASARLDRVPSAAKVRVAAALAGVLERHEEHSAPPRELERATRSDTLVRLGTRWGVVGAVAAGAVALSVWLQATPAQKSSVRSTARELVLESKATSKDPDRGDRPEVAASPTSLPSADRSESNPEAGAAAEPDRKAPPRPDPSGRQRAKAGAPRAHVMPVESGLLAEVRALEAVSSALGAGRTEHAARELDAYRRRFTRAELSIEAEVLAIQIAVARGQDEAASAAALQLLARPEAQHYRARVRALLDHQRTPPGPAPAENVGQSRSNDAAAHMRGRR